MKKLLTILMVLMLTSLVFAAPWSHRYDVWQAEENDTINAGLYTFAVEWGEGGWTSTTLGYGKSTNGSGWIWIDIPWVEDGEGTNKRCSTVVDFSDTTGVFYYVFKMTKDGFDYHNNGSAEWDESTTDFAGQVSSFLTVNDFGTPITLASFTAKAKNGIVEVMWTTGSETENSHFIVYRDGDAIAQVDGAGTTSESNDYKVVDNAVTPGVHEYALADVSYAGVEKVHETVSVDVSATVEAVDFVLNKAYPNPFNPSTAISYQLSAVSNVDLCIYNTSGELIETLYRGEHPAGAYELVWNAANMPSGVYIVKLLAGNVISSQKIVLMK